MATRFDDEVMEVTTSILAKYRFLKPEDLPRLIKVLESYPVEPAPGRSNAIHFPNLIRLLANTENEVPQYLTTDAYAIQAYTDEQTDQIALMLATRYWLKKTKETKKYFHLWAQVFSVSRQTHREARGVSLRNLDILSPVHSREEWTMFLSDRPEPCQGLGFDRLREKYFPTGIDEAIPGFMRHYVTLRDSGHELSVRCKQLNEHVSLYASVDKLYDECMDVIAPLRSLLATNLHRAATWYKQTADALALAQLPGAEFGLRFGHVVCYDHTQNLTLQLLPTEPRPPYHNTAVVQKPQWVPKRGLFFPIRVHAIRPGSSWCDWLCNIHDDKWTAIQVCRSPFIRFACGQRAERPVNKIAIHIPATAVVIKHHFDRVFNVGSRICARYSTVPVVDNATKEANSISISEGTGEPYWRVRAYEVDEGIWRSSSMRNKVLKYRPFYDGMGNLRYDYMNKVLLDIQARTTLSDYRSDFDVIVLS